MGRRPTVRRPLKRRELLAALDRVEFALRTLAADVSLPGTLRLALIQIANAAAAAHDRTRT